MSGRDKVRIQTEQAEAPVSVDAPPAPTAIPDGEPGAEGGAAAAPTDNSVAMPVTAAGTTWVTYRGHAAVVVVGKVALRPGVPVELPKDVAEGLLTHPFEEFEVSSEAPPPPPVEE